MSEMPWRFDFEVVGRHACAVQRFMDAVDAEAVSIEEWWFRCKESEEILEACNDGYVPLLQMFASFPLAWGSIRGVNRPRGFPFARE